MPIKVTILGCFPVFFKVLISLSRVSLAMALGSQNDIEKKTKGLLNFSLRSSLAVSGYGNKIMYGKSGLIKAVESVQRRQ